MGINLNSYEEAKEMCRKFVDNEDFSENVRMIASLNFTLVSACEELNNINKNLEKIANNTEKDSGVSIPTIQAIGNFFKEETRKLKELDSDTIVCNINKYEPIEELNLGTKSQHVDKNIILD